MKTRSNFFNAAILALLFMSIIACTNQPSGNEQNQRLSEYEAIQDSLQQGWNSYNTRDVLSQVLMPEGLMVSYDLKYQGKNIGGYLNSAVFYDGEEWSDARVQPQAHAPDGSYSKMHLAWEDVETLIETAHHQGNLLVLFTPAADLKHPSSAIIRPGFLWNKPGRITARDGFIRAQAKGRSTDIYPVTDTVQDFNVDAANAYFALPLNDGPAALATGKAYSLEEVKQLIAQKRNAFRNKARQYSGKLGDAWEGVTTAISWNTIYEPVHKRVVSTVDWSWNKKRGGYSFFGWDNFFLAYIAGINSKELAFANAIEHVHETPEAGFVPNCSQGNGRMTWDRSQPPVGSMMIREIYKRFPEKWFLDTTFEALLTWNRWWNENRMYKGMLAWGSHDAKNPFNDGCFHDICGASLESGMDDSPMYVDVPFNTEQDVMRLHDVGLNSLYVADCRALADIAQKLGKTQIEQELRKRADTLAKRVQENLWDEEDGFYYNRRTDSREFYKRKSPTLFYPLIAGIPTEAQAQKMIDRHFMNPEEFAGDWMIPTISRDDPAFDKQRYWKGAIWPPTNFLTYLGLCNYDLPEARKMLADKSLKMFVQEWNRRHYVAENYSAITGTADGPRIKSNPFYTWGALMGVIPLIEAGHLPDPAASLE